MLDRLQLSLRQKIAAGIVSALLILVVGAASYVAVNRATRASETVSRSHAILLEQERLLSALKDAETAARGYVLTADPDFLNPFYPAAQRVQAALGRLRLLAAFNARHMQRLDTLESVSRQQIELADQIIRIRNTSGFDLARALIATGQSRMVMDHARAITGAIEGDERALLAERAADEQRSHIAAAIVIVAGAVIAFFLAWLVNRGIAREALEREEQRRLIESQARKLRTQSDKLSRQLRDSRELADQLASTNQHLEAASAATGEARARAEEALRQATAAEEEQARLAREVAALLESTDQGFCGLDRSGVCTFVNRAGAGTLGYEQQELIGRSLHEATHFKRADGSSYPESECPIVRAIERGEASRVSNEVFWRKDGSAVAVEYSTSPILEAGMVRGAVVAFADITERLQAERALRGYTAQLGGLTEAAIAINSTLTADAMIQLATEHARNILGARRAETRLLPTTELGGAELAGGTQQERVWHAAEQTESITSWTDVTREMPAMSMDAIEAELASQALEPLAVAISERQSISAAMKRGDGSLLGTITLSGKKNGDFTEADEAVLTQLAHMCSVALENARLYKAAQDATRARDDLVAIVSHDLRNPVHTINMAASFLLEIAPAEDRRKTSRRQIEVIQRAATRANRLIQDLLDVARIQAGGLAVEPAVVSVSTLVREAAEAAAPMAVSSGLSVQFELPPEETGVRADHDRILQVLANLTGNAIKFTPKGGEIRLTAVPDGPDVRFCVMDTGPGIPPEHLDHVFDRYWQAKSTAKLGTGLGLSIAKGIIEVHGGRIWAESPPGEGARFYFVLPAVVADY